MLWTSLTVIGTLLVKQTDTELVSVDGMCVGM